MIVLTLFNEFKPPKEKSTPKIVAAINEVLRVRMSLLTSKHHFYYDTSELFFQDGELKSFLGVLFLRPFCGEIVQVFSKKDWSELEV